MQETSTKPYLLRALYEWCTDNGYTPHIAVRVDQATRVPRQFVQNGEIVLNISFEATSQLQMGNEWIEFSARFAGKAHKIEVQVANVLAIYARENGQGMAFPVEPSTGESEGLAESDYEGGEGESEVHEGQAEGSQAETEAHGDEPTPPEADGGKGAGKAHLKIVK